MAGQIAELARETLRSDFRSADPGSGRILLIEAADRALTALPPSLSAKAERSHRKLGVIPGLGSTVVDVDETGVTIARMRTTRRGAFGPNRRLGRRRDRLGARLGAGRAHGRGAGPRRSREEWPLFPRHSE
jgi:NADH:ubiquinone reductase (H+-translocating)